MAAPSRTAQLTRLHKILRKHYAPVSPDAKRTVLEHLLFASCLENAHYAVAEEAFAALVHTFYDWNEVRVSSVRELSEVMANLPDPAAAAHRVKRILQSVFEATYSFDVEEVRKQNLGPAVERLEKIEGTTRFSVAYVVQSALGGHSIPLDAGTLGALRTVDLIAEEDASAGVVPGLERAIPKNSGIEFGSLLHQLGADYVASPYAPAVHTILLEIDPKAKDRLPSRRGPKRVLPEIAPPAAAKKTEAKSQKGAAEAGPAPPKETAEPKAAPGAKAPAKGAAAEAKQRPTTVKRKPSAEPPSAEPRAAAPEPPRKKEVAGEVKGPEAAKKRPTAPAKKAPPKKKAQEADAKGETESGEEASSVEGLAKRKPR